MVQARLMTKQQKVTVRMEWMEQLFSVDWFRPAGCALGAYFLGCFAVGYYLVRARTGNDIRELGSGSVGARNVGRVLGKSGFVLTVLGDLTKGALAVWFAAEFTNYNRLAMAMATLAVVAGHIWPAQLHFRGGKGVATSFGALLMFDHRVALTILALFLGGSFITRKSLFPAMFAFVCLPLADWCFNHDGLTTTIMIILTVIILFAHRKNLAAEFAVFGARHATAPEGEQPRL